MVQISKNNALAGQFYLLFFMSSCSIVLFERGLAAWKLGGRECRKIKSDFCSFFSFLLAFGNFYFNCHRLRKIERIPLRKAGMLFETIRNARAQWKQHINGNTASDK